MQHLANNNFTQADESIHYTRQDLEETALSSIFKHRQVIVLFQTELASYVSTIVRPEEK